MFKGGHSKKTVSRLVTFVLSVVIITLGATAWISWHKYSQLKKNPNAAQQETTKRLTKEIGAMYQLPQNEQPTVAQVQDKTKLKDQAFFKLAQNGDYILIRFVLINSDRQVCQP